MQTELTRLVGRRVPIVQTGMGYVSGPRLVSATAKAGGLGIIASATMSLRELDAAVDEVRSSAAALMKRGGSGQRTVALLSQRARPIS